MRILVTGGTGVVGTETVTRLVAHGHSVVLLSRHAAEDVAQWPEGVTARPGDVARPETLRGAADGCDAVVHMVAIVDEHPPAATFQRVNVDGTRHLLAEAARAGVGRFVFVSSLGADRGESDYHRSKAEGERLVRGFGGEWMILRPGNVYGPGDEQISLLLRMVRTLPAIPVVGGGDQPFQPAWHEDVAEAIARAVGRDDLVGQALDLAGPEMTSQNDLLGRLTRITDRDVARIPVPEFLAKLGMKALGAVGVDAPINEGQLRMLAEGNHIPDGGTNALVDVLGVEATGLDAGLRRLAEAQAEQLPEEGVGAMVRKRFHGDVQGGRFSAEAMSEYLRTHFDDVTPQFLRTHAEPGAPTTIAEGETLTLALPLRGHVQVRVAEVTDRRITMLTLEGHPLAGAVRFLVEPRGDRVRVEVQVFERAATVVDLLAMRTVGDFLQNRSWEAVVRNLAEAAGGTLVEGVVRESESLDDAQEDRVEEWLERLVVRLKREEHATG